MKSAHGIYASNFGTSAAFPAVAVPGGFSVQNNVQLVSARADEPTQWVITLAPVVTTASKAVVPWESSKFDGVVGALTAAVPTIPVNEGGNGYKVHMTWGAGGVRNEAIFDYPMAGCSFGVAADQLDLSVIVLGVPTTIYTDLGLVPVFGAQMVRGHCAGGVRLTDVAQNVGATAVQHVAWTVKPYSRYLHVSRALVTNVGKLYSVLFFQDAPVGIIAGTFLAIDDGSQNTSERPLMVPPQATFVQLQNADPVPPAGAADFWRVTWEMYFS